MRKLIKSLLAGSVAVAVMGLAQAQAGFTYTQGDLLIGFRTASGANDLVADIGRVAGYDFRSSSFSYTPGVATALSQFSTLNPNSINGGNTVGLYFSVIGDTAANSLYLTKTRTGTLPGNYWSKGAETAWATGSGDSFGTVGAQIESVGVNTGNYGTDTAVNNVRTESHTLSGGYTASVTGNLGGTWTGSVEQNFGSGKTAIYSDLFEINPNDTADGLTTYLGYFTVASSGAVSFTAVPEPGTFGILAGVGVLLMSVRRQLKGQRA